jgi:GNAT superfamily N-acetyltransferase
MSAGKITMNNKNDPTYEAIFDNLIQEVFGFSFSPWFKRGLWSDNYESHSITENGKMLSNVCIFKSELVVGGKKIRANQFGAIATRKTERGKGLSRRLMEHVLSLYPDTPAYLAANPSVIDFYPRFGFRQLQLHKPEIAAKIYNSPAKAVKYTLETPALAAALSSRGFHSQSLDCLNAHSIQVFHLLMEYGDDIYFLPSINAVAIAQQYGNRLFLADVITTEPVSFESLARELPFTNIETVEFGFNPDWLGITPEWIAADTSEEPFFIWGEWNLPEKCRFPAMSET